MQKEIKKFAILIKIRESIFRVVLYKWLDISSQKEILKLHTTSSCAWSSSHTEGFKLFKYKLIDDLNFT